MDKKSNEILAALVKDILRVGRGKKRTVHEAIAAVAVESYRLGYRCGETGNERGGKIMNEKDRALLSLIRDVLVEGQGTDRELVQGIATIAIEAYRLGYKHGMERKPGRPNAR